MDSFSYSPVGVCGKKFDFEIENNILKKVIIYGGCPGYSLGLSKLITGMDIDKIIIKLKGTRCGMKSTSCPDQIAIALETYKKNKK